MGERRQIPPLALLAQPLIKEGFLHPKQPGNLSLAAHLALYCLDNTFPYI
jgi:hypothetical protein